MVNWVFPFFSFFLYAFQTSARLTRVTTYVLGARDDVHARGGAQEDAVPPLAPISTLHALASCLPRACLVLALASQ